MSQSTPESSVIAGLCALAAHLTGARSARVVMGSPEAGAGVRVPLLTDDGVQVAVLELLGTPDGATSVEHLPAVTSALVAVLEVEDLRAELFDSQERAARAEETLQEAAGQLVHDVNNPLAAAAMALEIARDQVEDGLVAQLLDRAAGGTTRMKRMVTDLLGFSAPSGVGEASVREVLEPLLAEFDGLPLGAAEPPETDARVAMAPGDLEAVLLALLENAVKFSGDEPRVRVDVSAGPDVARVAVHDAGRGVPEVDRDRVFTPTLRLDRKIPGTGLGLSTARRLVRAAGGTIGVEESPWGGATVWFEVPLAASS